MSGINQVTTDLGRRRWHRVWRWLLVGTAGTCLVVGAVSTWWAGRYAFAVHRLTRGVGDTVFYGADGKPWFRLDERRHDVALSAIAPELQRAVVAVEDRRFYYHPGIDPIGLARAVWYDLRTRDRAQGGSTLTQQLARTLFLSNVRTFGRKAKEAVIALLLEIQLSKPQILELYLNRVYLSAGVYGVEAMSEHLFRKPSARLTLPEAALVAGLIRAPSALSPWTNYEGALRRSHTVLALMRDQGLITTEQEQTARAVRPRVQPYRSPESGRAGWVKDFLRQQFRNEFGGDHPPDWQVHTSFRPDLQDHAERAVTAGLKRWQPPGLEAALVAMNPKTGDVLAMVGGADYTRSTFNRATRSRRQPGSAFKPLVYTAALAHGLSPVSVLSHLDRVGAPNDPEWRPRTVTSVEGEDRSAVTLRDGLADSNNAAAAALQQRVGSHEVLRLASAAGLPDLPDVPSLALGTGLVSPLNLTAAYTMYPGAGEVVRPRGIITVLDADGDLMLERPVQRTRVTSGPVAFQALSMLRDVVEVGTAASVRSLGVVGPVAGKTGTTDDYRDAWFVGFSSAVVVGVWVGRDQPTPIGDNAYAARVAVPIWADFMRRAAPVLPAREFVAPPGIEIEQLCRVSHLKPVQGCPSYAEYFKEGDEIPGRLCPVHEGTIKQSAARAVQKAVRAIGSKIAGLFRRRG